MLMLPAPEAEREMEAAKEQGAASPPIWQDDKDDSCEGIFWRRPQHEAMTAFGVCLLFLVCLYDWQHLCESFN